MNKKKLYILTTIPNSLNFFSGQIYKLGKIYDVTLISSFADKLEDIANKEKVKYKKISMQREISFFKDIISFIKFLLFFIFNRPYAIHCNTPKASLLGLVAGFILRIPIRIYYIHGLRYEGAYGRKRQLLKFIEFISCWCATDIIAVSHGVKKTVQFDIIERDIKVIHNGSPNGLDVEKFINFTSDEDSTRAELNIDKKDFIFGFIGRIVSDKGINELVSAFNKLPQKNIKLVLVGRYEELLDPLKTETLNIIKNNSNIIECGYQNDIRKFLSIMDIFVSPSYREGFGLSVIEANAMGKAAIVTSITGYEEIIKDGYNGFYIIPKDEQNLYNQMLNCMQMKLQLKEMSHNCRLAAVDRFLRADVQNIAINYYRNLIG